MYWLAYEFYRRANLLVLCTGECTNYVDGLTLALATKITCKKRIPRDDKGNEAGAGAGPNAKARTA